MYRARTRAAAGLSITGRPSSISCSGMNGRGRAPFRGILSAGWPAVMAVLLWLSTAGCASISPAAVNLSVEIGEGISHARAQHLALAREYFSKERSRIETYLEEQWIPELTSQMLDRQRIKDEWTAVARSNDTAARVLFFANFGTALQREIDRKRREYLGSVEEAEKVILVRVSDHYDRLLSANATLTARLDAAARLDRSRERALRTFGVDETLTADLSRYSELVEVALSGKDALTEHKDRIGRILDEIRRGRAGGSE